MIEQTRLEISMSRFQRLLSYLKPHWKKSTLGVFALLVVNALGVYIPWLIREGIDELQVTFSFDRIVYYAGIIIALATAMWFVRVASRIWMFGVGRQVEFDLKQEIFEHLLTLEPAYFSENRIGDLINRATSDVDNIRRLLGFAVLSLVNTIFAYALTLPAMLAINVRLTLFALAIYPLMFLLVWVSSDRLRSEQMEVQERLSTVSQLVQEDTSGMGPIKIYAQEENERRAFDRYNKDLLDANLKLARTRTILFPLLQALAGGSLLILLAFGSRPLINGTLDVGGFVALVLYVERLVFPTAILGFTLTTYQRGEVSIDRIDAILQVDPKIQDPENAIDRSPEDIKGNITARGLSYTYPGAEIPALTGADFDIEAGETVAIVGAVGSGKSTLANAIPRLLDIQEGQLFLDGCDVTQLRLQDLRGAISYVPQDSFLFSTTIVNNIRYGRPESEGWEVETAAKQAQIHEEILNFPKQYETIVGERGITLSGGQRQRTALARALLIDAPVLILDDALSSVDNQTATQILHNLSTGTQRKTVVFVSHQLSAAASADRIFVVDRGRIVQAGTHDRLLSETGLYRDLWKYQKFEAAMT